MAITHRVKQGNSYWLDVTGNIEEIDPSWTNWEGKWVIVATVGSTPLASGNLIRTATSGKFRFQLEMSDSATLAVGEYLLIIQVENVSAGYRKEFDPEAFIVEAQGIIP